MEVGAVVRLIPPYMQGARGEETSRAAAVEVELGSEQWGRKERIELCWQRESVTVSRAKERILERLREKQDRRTPVPVTSFLSSW